MFGDRASHERTASSCLDPMFDGREEDEEMKGAGEVKMVMLGCRSSESMNLAVSVASMNTQKLINPNPQKHKKTNHGARKNLSSFSTCRLRAILINLNFLKDKSIMKSKFSTITEIYSDRYLVGIERKSKRSSYPLFHHPHIRALAADAFCFGDSAMVGIQP